RSNPGWEQIVELFCAAAKGLAAAHRAGLVHRDFKPDNVLIGSDGRPRVLDFGLARQAASTAVQPAEKKPDLEQQITLTTPLTQAGAIMGTPAYMSLEQLYGDPIDERTDQFA